MDPLQQLMQMAQAAGVGGPLQGQRVPKAPGGPTSGGGGGGKRPMDMDPQLLLSQLQELGAAGPSGSGVRDQVMQATAGGPGGRLSSGERDPMVAALMRAENAGMSGLGMGGPATDGDLEAMMRQSEAMGVRPPGPSRGMMGERDDLMSDIRQTPEPYSEDEMIGLRDGQRTEAVGNKKGGSPNGMPAFAQEGRPATGSPSGMPRPAGLGRKATGTPSGLGHMPSTEDELAMVSDRMGENSDFPSESEIKALNEGKIDPKAFDAKWGKGAAKEMMEQEDSNLLNNKNNDADDDGDHEYR